MKVVQFDDYGESDKLALGTSDRPEPAAGEVLVRVYAAGVNFLDCKIRAGLMQHVLKLSLPVVPGAEIAGTVERVGEGVDRFRPGDAVFGQIASCVGGYAEWAVAKADHLASKPPGLSFAQAASLPVSAATAWMAVEAANLSPGQRVLVHGAGGGVGRFAVQFARLAGAHVIGTASASKAAFVRDLGASEVVEYDRERFESVLDPVDVVLDFVGSDTMDRSWGLLKPGGVLAGAAAPPDADKAAAHDVRSAFIILRPDGERLGAIGELIEAGKVDVGDPATFELGDAARAHDLCETRHAPGRIVLTVDPEAIG